jgi:hypothetical protein
MLAAPTIYAAAWSLLGTISDRPIPQSSSAKKVFKHCEFSEKFGNLIKITVSPRYNGIRYTGKFD